MPARAVWNPQRGVVQKDARERARECKRERECERERESERERETERARVCERERECVCVHRSQIFLSGGIRHVELDARVHFSRSVAWEMYSS